MILWLLLTDLVLFYHYAFVVTASAVRRFQENNYLKVVKRIAYFVIIFLTQYVLHNMQMGNLISGVALFIYNVVAHVVVMS